MSILPILAITLTYALLLVVFTISALQHRKKEQHLSSATTGISIVVALRNEENNVVPLVEALLVQQYPHELFEIILVNDHSTDNTIRRIPIHPLIKVIHLTDGSQGKKAALKLGVATARFPYSALTDADCRPTPFWISRLAALAEAKSTSLIVGPVAMQYSQGIVGAFQHWEFRILQTVTYGSAALGFPTMCNGANLLVRTSDYNSADLKEGSSPSGDDMFLLHHLLKLGRKVLFTQASEVLVFTFPETSFKAMLQQQLRWASKSKHFTHPATITLGLITLFTNIGLVILTIITAIGRCPFELMVELYGLKIVAEAISAYLPRQKVHGKQPSIFSFLLSSLVMPFYATFVAIASAVVKIRWKDRSIV